MIKNVFFHANTDDTFACASVLNEHYLFHVVWAALLGWEWYTSRSRGIGVDSIVCWRHGEWLSYCILLAWGHHVRLFCVLALCWSPWLSSFIGTHASIWLSAITSDKAPTNGSTVSCSFIARPISTIIIIIVIVDLYTHVQGGPAKVRPTYIFDGNIWMHQ